MTAPKREVKSKKPCLSLISLNNDCSLRIAKRQLVAYGRNIISRKGGKTTILDLIRGTGTPISPSALMKLNLKRGIFN